MASSWGHQPVEPRVWMWYRVYAGFMGGLYLLVMLGGIALAVFAPSLEGGGGEMPEMPRFMGVMYAVIGLPFAAAYLAAFFIPRVPWAWIYHLVLICVGLTSVCCMPATIPLLIFWLKPETKVFFGRQP